MPVWVQSLLSAHAILVAIAVFTLISTVLTAVGSGLQSIGDKVPGWLGTVIGWSGKVVHFLNGIIPSVPTPPSAS